MSIKKWYSESNHQKGPLTMPYTQQQQAEILKELGIVPKIPGKLTSRQTVLVMQWRLRKEYYIEGNYRQESLRKIFTDNQKKGVINNANEIIDNLDNILNLYPIDVVFNKLKLWHNYEHTAYEEGQELKNTYEIKNALEMRRYFRGMKVYAHTEEFPDTAFAVTQGRLDTDPERRKAKKVIVKLMKREILRTSGEMPEQDWFHATKIFLKDVPPKEEQIPYVEGQELSGENNIRKALNFPNREFQVVVPVTTDERYYLAEVLTIKDRNAVQRERHRKIKRKERTLNAKLDRSQKEITFEEAKAILDQEEPEEHWPEGTVKLCVKNPDGKKEWIFTHKAVIASRDDNELLPTG